MIISIASGKGGTGKTTVAVNLALSLNNVQLLDCDVEEPNCHLFLNLSLNRVEDVSIPIPKVDKNRCDFCRKCSEFCQYRAIAVLPSDVLLFPELCHGCGGCSLVCPRNAISEEERVIGLINRGNAKGLEFYQGILNVGEPMATPVIRKLKKKIVNTKIAILDASPGTSCPVVETIRGTDYCILVTEPTPFGLYDLKLAVSTVRKLNVPFGVVINRDGIGDDRIERYCEDSKIPILMRVPQDIEIAKLYSVGRPFVLEMPEWKDSFISMFKNVQSEDTK